MDRNREMELKGLAFIRAEVRDSGRMPSLRKIADAIGYPSPRSVQLMLERLAKQGLLKYENGVIELIAELGEPGERTVDVPVVGAVACGLPTLADQNPEAWVSISTRIARPGHKYFFLRAEGNSMDLSGIQDGDLVLIKQQAIANQGERVVALIDESATIKHFHRTGEHVVLKPNSSDKTCKPIVVTDDLIIQGIVVAVIPDPFS
jgi:repressor LexA